MRQCSDVPGFLRTDLVHDSGVIFLCFFVVGGCWFVALAGGVACVAAVALIALIFVASMVSSGIAIVVLLIVMIWFGRRDIVI